MCYDDQARPPLPPGAVGPAHGEDVTLTASDGTTFAAYLAIPEAAAKAQMLILPDVRGLHQFYKELALRFAETGVAAVAIDYFGRTAGIGARDESFDFWPHVHQLVFDQVFVDAAAGLELLGQRTGAPLPSFTVGFCMGGMLSFLAGTQALDLRGVIGFYGVLSNNRAGASVLDRASAIHCPVLGLFGGDDPAIPTAEIAAFDQALDQSGVPHELVVYPDAPHSFFDRRADDFAQASADAWAQVARFITTYATPAAP